jgi:hydrogenase maturation protease
LPRSVGGRAKLVHLLICGHRHQRDGGAAVWVTPRIKELLREQNLVDVRALRSGELAMSHLLNVPRGAPLVIADATSHTAPGEIVVRTLDELIDEPNGPGPHSARGQPINQLLGVANCLAEAPLQGEFVGLGGADFGVGMGVSQQVADRLDDYAEAIVDRVEQLQQERGKSDFG